MHRTMLSPADYYGNPSKFPDLFYQISLEIDRKPSRFAEAAVGGIFARSAGMFEKIS